MYVAKPVSRGKGPASRRQEVSLISALGPVHDPALDLEMVCLEAGLDKDFAPEVLAASEHLGLDSADPATKRKDLRHLPFFTIDGVDAKDFDDAVCWQNPHTLYVAVADVASYVTQNSLLDIEAAHRGNSCYFPGFVIPMLPEALSNELCSLKPLCDRRVLVVEMRFEQHGSETLISSDVYPAWIRSQARLTYDSVAKLLNQTAHDVPKHLSEQILDLGRHTRGIRTQRLRSYSLELQGFEKKAWVDARGNPIALVKRTGMPSEQLIEECMLLANVEVARYLKRHKLPGFWRSHPPPEAAKMQELADLLTQFKVKVDPEFIQGDAEAIRQALAQVLASPHASFLPHYFLRAMNQAYYTHKEEGHYGLGFKDYAHFTSPIRRYADLINHRSLHTYWQQGKVTEQDLVPKVYPSMSALGTHISGTERVAQRAEFDVYDLKAARYMQPHIGAIFSGIVVKCLKFGMILELEQHPVTASLPRENFLFPNLRYDVRTQSWLTPSRKERIRIGARLDVRLERIDLPHGRIEVRQVLGRSSRRG